jgi:hypothetical protein
MPQYQGQQAPYVEAGPYAHPVPPQAPSNGGGTGSGPKHEQILPSGAEVVTYIDKIATRLPWWFWLGSGIAGYHFLYARPIWKSLRKSGS